MFFLLISRMLHSVLYMKSTSKRYVVVNGGCCGNGVLASVTSTLSGAMVHVEEPCAIWGLYLLQQVHSTQPGGVVYRLLPYFFEIVDIQ